MSDYNLEDRIWTVYCHTNKINGKKYIGITSRKVKEQWKGGSNYKTCTAFNNAIKKYGWNNFEHEILFEQLTENEANNKEYELINLLNTKVPNGYNLNDGGKAHKMHPESIKKAIENNPNRRRVLCVTTGKIFDSIAEAGREYNLGKSKKSHISEVCKGKCATYGRSKNRQIPLVWRYIDENNEIIEPENKPPETRLKVIKCNETQEIFGSIKMACEAYHLSSSTIIDNLKGKLKSGGTIPGTMEKATWVYVPFEDWRDVE